MSIFEVIIPENEGVGSESNAVRVDASSWVMAFKQALSLKGEDSSTVKNIMVEKGQDGSMRVSHPKSGRIFIVRQIEAETGSSVSKEADDHMQQSVSKYEKSSPGSLCESRKETKRQEKPAPKSKSSVEKTKLPQRKKTREEMLKHFQVFIPAGDNSTADYTITLMAPSWIAAVRSGLGRIGEPQDSVKNIMVERKDDGSMVINHPKSNRVFRVKELTAAEAAKKDALSIAQPATPSPELMEEPPQLPEVAAHLPREEVFAHTQQQEEVSEPGLEFLEPEEIPSAEELLESFFEDAALLGAMSLQDAIDFCLDLALDKVDSEGGSIILADINNDDLFYSTSRGPWAEKLLGHRLEQGQGLLGFTIEEGVGMVLSEMDDPTMVAEISERLSTDVLNVLYAPLEADRRIFGAMELVNRMGRQNFGQEELNAITFLGTKLAERLLIDEGARL
ncbi:MAG: hypothetical protein GXP49_01115 [Deltaproteobacteria bacterium]|nr:hypothetical protein [Deltaproteobacteria bacterium]